MLHQTAARSWFALVALVRDPDDADLLLSACKGYTQYAQAFVSQPADALESTDLKAARRADWLLARTEDLFVGVKQ